MKLQKILYSLVFALSSVLAIGQNEAVKVYLIPGQGADYRLFSKLSLKEGFDTVHIKYSIPAKGTTMNDYARELSRQIDTSQPFVLIGTSLGGMLAAEMKRFMKPQQVIIISSAKCRKELPKRYKFQKGIPIYKLFGGRMLRGGAKLMQPIVEPDRRGEKHLFKAMLKAKKPRFMKRSIKMIIEWELEDCDERIIHIHGDNDHTLPIKNVSTDHILEKGSHMMTLIRAQELSTLLNSIL